MPNTLNGVLAQIPGLAGYEAGRLNNQNTDMANMGLLQRIHAVAQQQALEQAKLQFLKDQAANKPDRTVVSPGATVLEGGKPIYTAPFKPETDKQFAPPELVALIEHRSKMQPGDPNIVPIDARIKYLTERSQVGERPYITPIHTSTGVVGWDTRKGEIVRPKDNPVIRSQDDPKLQQDLAAGKAAGKEYGEAGAQGVLVLPKIIDNSMMASRLIDQMVGSQDGQVKPHPGFKSYIGFSLRPGASLIHGTPEANFKAFLDQSTGGAFLQAFETLKGGGQITVIEGEKATNAITRMNKAQSEQEFVKAARDFQEVIEKGLKRAQNRAKMAPQPSAPAAAPRKVIKFNELPD